MATPGIEESTQSFETEGEISESEKELLREELKKTENEINTLRQLLAARQKHVASLKRKLGISPLNEITSEMSQGIKAVKDTPVFQKTSEMVAGTAETVVNKWQDMRNSSLFNFFESKIGSAYNNAKIAASTSIDHLAGAARGGVAPSNNSKIINNLSQNSFSHSEQSISPLS